MVEVDYLTFKCLQAVEEESEANATTGSTGGGEGPSVEVAEPIKKRKSILPSQLHLLAKYAMDLCIVEDKEFHLAVFVDGQLVV